MTGMELVPETSVFNQLTRLIAREYFINNLLLSQNNEALSKEYLKPCKMQVASRRSSINTQ
jgi:hypothetical protein